MKLGMGDLFAQASRAGKQVGWLGILLTVAAAAVATLGLGAAIWHYRARHHTQQQIREIMCASQLPVLGCVLLCTGAGGCGGSGRLHEMQQCAGPGPGTTLLRCWACLVHLCVRRQDCCRMPRTIARHACLGSEFFTTLRSGSLPSLPSDPHASC